jgi:prepilin-type N-terminal cleavage/methylation domain-containing protein
MPFHGDSPESTASPVILGQSPTDLKFRGFTLIEILVVLASLSVVVLVLYSSLFLSKKAVNIVDEPLLRLQEARILVDTMKRELESSLYSVNKAYTVFNLYDREFFGRQTSKLIITTFSSVLPGLVKVQYYAEEVEGKLVLKRQLSSAFSVNALPTSEDMIENIESFTVEARYRDKWVKTWDSAFIREAPEEVRISVLLPSTETKDRKTPDSPISVSDTAKIRTGKMP